MIQMRKAGPEERGAVAALWGAVFGDDAAFLDAFYRLCAPYEKTMVLLEDGALRAILCAPEVTLRCPNGRALRCGYMYALATDPIARGRGFGGDLMRYGAACLKSAGADCALLVPAEPSLFRFFDALGYSPAFSHIRRELPRDSISAPAGEDRLERLSPAAYNALRREHLAGRLYVDYSDGLAAFQQELSRSCGGDLHRLILPGGTGCAAVEPDGDTVTVKELLCAAADVPRAAALLAREYPAERYVLRLPPWTEAPERRTPWGALLWLHGHPSPWCPPGEDGYLGLAFD